MDKFQKIFSIHFPGRRVYIEHTFNTLEGKIEVIKNDKDHKLYTLLEEYPNPEIRFECYRDKSCNEKLVASIYKKEKFKILN